MLTPKIIAGEAEKLEGWAAYAHSGLGITLAAGHAYENAPPYV